MIRDDQATALYGEAGDDMLYGNVADNLIDGGSGADQIIGAGGDDTLLGGDGMDHVSGGSGDDVVDGGTGADELIGGAGDDILTGGLGDDVIDGGADDDVATYTGKMADYKVEVGAQGIDKVIDLKAGDGDEGDFSPGLGRFELGPDVADQVGVVSGSPQALRLVNGVLRVGVDDGRPKMICGGLLCAAPHSPDLRAFVLCGNLCAGVSSLHNFQ